MINRLSDAHIKAEIYRGQIKGVLGKHEELLTNEQYEYIWLN